MIYVVAQQHPTLPEVSMFTTKSKADADQYQAIGWTVLEIEEPVQPAAKLGRTNSGDETGGTVKRFGFDVSNGKSDIIPATNGAYVYYDDYLALHRKLEPQSALIDAELPELPRPDRNAWPHGFHDLYTAQQMRDYTQQATAPILAKLATQVALVEKCMVAMNENADKGEKAEAELARLKAQPAAWAVLLQQSQANFQKNFGGNVAANWVYNDLRELFADAAPVQPAPLTRKQIDDAVNAAGYEEPQERADFINGMRHCELAHGIIGAAVRTGGAG